MNHIGGCGRCLRSPSLALELANVKPRTELQVGQVDGKLIPRLPARCAIYIEALASVDLSSPPVASSVAGQDISISHLSHWHSRCDLPRWLPADKPASGCNAANNNNNNHHKRLSRGDFSRISSASLHLSFGSSSAKWKILSRTRTETGQTDHQYRLGSNVSPEGRKLKS